MEDGILKQICNISNSGEVYATYADFFKEQKANSKGFVSHYSPYSDELKDWYIIKKGFHRDYTERELLILEKEIRGEIRKIVIGINGVNKVRYLREFVNPLIYNKDIWQETLK